MSEFAQRLLRWQRLHGRHDLPWQRDWAQKRDPYHVWLSEVMLQQTQVATVIPYYARFLARFPDLYSLALASVDEVMPVWSGLGYYARARNLHACAQQLVRAHAGVWPQTPEALASLPGIGRSTANAIAAVCFGARTPILDGNVKRVLCRAFGIEGVTTQASTERALWALAHELVPARQVDAYNQAQMDLGATLCARSKPRCTACPLADICVAYREGRTAQLPTPKARTLLPERRATFLVVCDERTDCAGGEGGEGGGTRVLLETRPPSGIWGGMQCLPELPDGLDAQSWLAQRLGARASAVSPAPSFVHVFSHFKLHITPLLCPLDQASPGTLMAHEPGWQWLDAEGARRAALPTPVRRILDQVLGAPE